MCGICEFIKAMEYQWIIDKKSFLNVCICASSVFAFDFVCSFWNGIRIRMHSRGDKVESGMKKIICMKKNGMNLKKNNRIHLWMHRHMHTCIRCTARHWFGLCNVCAAASAAIAAVQMFSLYISISKSNNEQYSIHLIASNSSYSMNRLFALLFPCMFHAARLSISLFLFISLNLAPFSFAPFASTFCAMDI